MFKKLAVIAGFLVVGFLALAAEHPGGQEAEHPGAQEAEQKDRAPDFELFGIDYRYHSPAMYEDAEALVLVFTCNHCPVAKSYEDKLVALAKEYHPKGIQFIAINTNPVDKVAADGFPQMQERAEEKGFPFPYLYDETQKISRAYGATVTPHIFVRTPDGKIAYEGAIDNRHDEPEYLANALDDILAGREVQRAKTAQFGCTVKYRNEDEQQERFNLFEAD
ncbi:MAG: thioredoxin family protein [Candidatus Brocadiia bacterium]